MHEIDKLKKDVRDLKSQLCCLKAKVTIDTENLINVFPTTPRQGDTYINTNTGEAYIYDGTSWGAYPDSIGVTDGDKSDIIVSVGGTVWTIDAGVVTLAKQANVASGTVFYRKTAGTGSPEVQTLATLKTDLGVDKVDFITVTQPVDLDQIEIRVNGLDAAVVIIGNWDASAGTFPGAGLAQSGWSYFVTVAGTVDGVSFAINDRLIAILDNASTTTYSSNWFKADYTDQVLSVNGAVGVVALTTNDVPDSLNKRYVTDAQQTVIGNTSGINTGDQSSIVGITGTLAEFNTALTGADFATGGGNVTGTSSGTNTGDQSSIVGITGTKAQFAAAVTDGDPLFVGDISQYTDELAQDAVGGMVDSSLVYVDGTPLLQRAALTGAITAPAGDNATVLGSFTKAQLDAALSDENGVYAVTTQTVTNKRMQKRVVATTQSATPTINTDNGDIFEIVGLAQAITSFTTNLSGTPVEGEMMMIIIKDNGTARALAWGASFVSSTVTLPTTTVISTPIAVILQYRTSAVWTATSAWYCVGVA